MTKMPIERGADSTCCGPFWTDGLEIGSVLVAGTELPAEAVAIVQPDVMPAPNGFPPIGGPDFFDF